MEEGGWSQPVGRTRQVYSVEAAKLKNKPVRPIFCILIYY
jgi:hypothetical protein